jgi:hypothetical protein
MTGSGSSRRGRWASRVVPVSPEPTIPTGMQDCYQLAPGVVKAASGLLVGGVVEC